MFGDFPPSSRLRRFRFDSPDAAISRRAVRMLPVKLILSMSMCRPMASPAVFP